MVGWQRRLLAEKKDLEEKADSLQRFIDGGEFGTLPVMDQVLLELQHNYMVAYLHVLARRIDRFPKEPT